MPIKKAAFKNLRQGKKRAARNMKVKANLSYLVKKSRRLLEKNDFEAAAGWVAKAVQALDKAAQKGVIKKNTAARKKSRLMKRMSREKKS